MMGPRGPPRPNTNPDGGASDPDRACCNPAGGLVRPTQASGVGPDPLEGGPVCRSPRHRRRTPVGTTPLWRNHRNRRMSPERRDFAHGTKVPSLDGTVVPDGGHDPDL